MTLIKTPRIALIGFMGSGKSTVGKLLAKRIGYGFVDLDSLIEEQTGKKIKDIFSEEGEKAFRQYESEQLFKLAKNKNIVIATGGGAPITEKNRPFFTEHAFTIFLDVPLSEMIKRTHGSDERPLLKMPKEKLQNLYKMRLPIYKSLGYPVDTAGKTPLEITEEIISLLVHS